MDDLAKNYVSVRQAARIRGVSRQAILKALTRWTLKGSRVDQFWLIHRRDLAAFEPRTDGGVVKVNRKKRARKSKRRGGRRAARISSLNGIMNPNSWQKAIAL